MTCWCPCLTYKEIRNGERTTALTFLRANLDRFSSAAAPRRRLASVQFALWACTHAVLCSGGSTLSCGYGAVPFGFWRPQRHEGEPSVVAVRNDVAGKVNRGGLHCIEPQYCEERQYSLMPAVSMIPHRAVRNRSTFMSGRQHPVQFGPLFEMSMHFISDTHSKYYVSVSVRYCTPQYFRACSTRMLVPVYHHSPKPCWNKDLPS